MELVHRPYYFTAPKIIVGQELFLNVGVRVPVELTERARDYPVVLCEPRPQEPMSPGVIEGGSAVGSRSSQDATIV